jgi:hypothetical protein
MKCGRGAGHPRDRGIEIGYLLICSLVVWAGIVLHHYNNDDQALAISTSDQWKTRLPRLSADHPIELNHHLGEFLGWAGAAHQQIAVWAHALLNRQRERLSNPQVLAKKLTQMGEM